MSVIITRAPFRISFAGGGTDLPAFYQREVGAVVSTTINKYVYVIVNRRAALFGRGVSLNCSPSSGVEVPPSPTDPFASRIRVSYSATENVEHAGEIRHPIVREALRLLQIDDPIDISTIADVPAGTGLGSSSTFAVALLHALHTFRGDVDVTPTRLAEEAAHIEVERLQRPIGKQDHFAAAFGGLNCFEFSPGDAVAVRRLDQPDGPERLFSHLMLFYTKVRRSAGAILTEQRANTADRHADLTMMRDQAHRLERLLADGLEPATFGQILHEGWIMKRTLASGITNPQIDGWYDRARSVGALGGKVCGAGGGGFLLLVVPSERQALVRAALADLPELSMQYEPQGSRVLHGGNTT